MTITEFLNGNTIASDAITAWTDRKGNSPDHVTSRLGFLRKHLAKHVKTNPIPEDTLITVARRKVEAFGLGEILTTADGNTFAAVAGQFRVLTASEAAPVPEAPVAEAAAPAKPKATKRIKKAKTAEVAPEVVQAAIEKVFEDAKDVPFTPEA